MGHQGDWSSISLHGTCSEYRCRAQVFEPQEKVLNGRLKPRVHNNHAFPHTPSPALGSQLLAQG